jgi:flavin-binding protein dodecin
MSVAKMIEISAESPDGFEAAVKEGIKKAGETVKNIKGAWIKEYEVTVDGVNVTAYRVKMKLTFVID